MVPKKNYCSIDLFKFLAAILVVAIHTRPFIANDALDYYFTCFCRIAVPFFFIATSFFFFSKEQPDIKRYTKRLAFLYLAWFIIEIPFVYQRFFIDFDRSLPLQVLNLIRSLIFSNTWYASWFIMACILSVNLIYWLSRKLNNRQLLLVGVLGYMVSLACSSYNGALDLLLSEQMRNFHASIANFFMPANSFIVALIYVVLGKIVAEKVQRNQTVEKKMIIVLFGVSMVLWGLEVFLIKWSVSVSDAFILLPAITLMGFALLLKTIIIIPPKSSRWLRDMSILIYILHSVFSSVNTDYFGIKNGGGMFFITLLESIVTASIIIGLSNRVPFLKKLY